MVLAFPFIMLTFLTYLSPPGADICDSESRHISYRIPSVSPPRNPVYKRPPCQIVSRSSMFTFML
jgi:hypothetical protein